MIFMVGLRHAGPFALRRVQTLLRMVRIKPAYDKKNPPVSGLRSAVR
jgi:hypothetical protein